MSKRKPKLPRWHVVGRCWSPGTHSSNEKIDRVVEAPTAEAAAEKTFKGAYHGALYCRPEAHKPGHFTALMGGQAMGYADVNGLD